MRSIRLFSIPAMCLALASAALPAVAQSGNAALQGQYAFLFTGKVGGPTGLAAGALASFTADGQGHITAGVLDFTTLTFSLQRQTVTGTYSLGSNGRGTITLNSTYLGPETFNVSVLASEASSLVETGTVTATTRGLIGSGKIARQSSPLSSPAGQYTLDLTGTDSIYVYAPLALTGLMNLGNGSGSAIGDVTGDGVTVPNVNYSGTIGTADPATGIFPITLVSTSTPTAQPLPGLILDGLEVDGGKTWLIETKPWAGKPYVVLSGVATSSTSAE
jgi:hypothetical protein